MVPPRSGRWRSRSPPRNRIKSFREERSRGVRGGSRDREHERYVDDRPGRYNQHPGARRRSRSPPRRARHSKSIERSGRFKPEAQYEQTSRNNERRISSGRDFKWENRFSPPPPGQQVDDPRYFKNEPGMEERFDMWSDHVPSQEYERGRGENHSSNQNFMPATFVENHGLNSSLNQRHGMDGEFGRNNFKAESDEQMDMPLTDASSAPVIPEFNPETCKLSSYEWVKLIEDTAKERDWKKDEKHYVMTSRLAGYARQWYLSVGVGYKSWHDLKGNFFKAFPSELGFVTLLQRMLNRVKEENESISTYFLHKVALLNECEIHGRKAVSCIIGGLQNAKTRYLAKCQNCEDPDQLYAFLRSQDDEAATRKPKEESKSKKKGGCYHCKSSDHFIANCPRAKINSVPDNEQPSGSRNGVMMGSLSRKPTYSKYFTEVSIGGRFLNAYVDQASEYTTIRESNMAQLNLPMKKQYKTVRGFAGSVISSLGYSEVPLCVDRAVVTEKLFVVPDHVQEIPVVVGQSFTEQPQVVVMKDGGDKVRFYQRMDSGQVNFDF